MSKVKIQGNASGTGVLTITAPNTSTDRTITLPDEDVTLGAAVGGASGVSFGDDVKAQFGAGNDLEIFHDGTHSYIKEAGTGDLRIKGTQLSLRSDSLDEPYINCTENGSVAVFHDNSKKLETTSTGIDVTGRVKSTNGFFYAGMSNHQTISYATWTKLNFDTDSGGTSYVDTAGFYDTTNYRFLPTIAGWYEFHAKIATNLSGNARLILAFQRNGSGASSNRAFDMGIADTTDYQLGGSYFYHLDGVDDYVECYVWQSLTNKIVYNSDGTHFSGRLVHAT